MLKDLDACNSILTDGDIGSGLVIKEAGLNLSSLLKSAGLKRQGTDMGVGCNAILTDGNTGSGLAVKYAGQNIAAALKSAGAKRQLDKANAGIAAIVGVVAPNVASYAEGFGDSIDGYSTTDSAVIGSKLVLLKFKLELAPGTSYQIEHLEQWRPLPVLLELLSPGSNREYN